MVERKLRDYAPHLGELRALGVEYRPLVWSCWRRPDIDATCAVRSMAQAASRRHGAVQARDLERRARRALGVQIWKHAAAMADTCRPALDSDEMSNVLPDAIAEARGRRANNAVAGCSARSHSSRSSSVCGSSQCSSRSCSPLPGSSPGSSSPVPPPGPTSVPSLAGGAQHGRAGASVAGTQLSGGVASPVADSRVDAQVDARAGFSQTGGAPLGGASSVPADAGA